MTITAEINDGRYSLWAVAVRAGEDISVTIGGGECAHIGAVAMSIARPGLDNPEKLSASTSVFCVTGHKDDELAKTAAHRLAVANGGTASVCAGIHIDNASHEDIRRLISNFDRLLQALEGKLNR